MKGQKYDEARAGVEDINLGQIPLQESEYYEYHNWLEPYLLDNPEKADLSEGELMKIFRNSAAGEQNNVISKSKLSADDDSDDKDADDSFGKHWNLAQPGDPESLT